MYVRLYWIDLENCSDLGAKNLHTYVFLDAGLGIGNEILKKDKNVGDVIDKYVFLYEKLWNFEKMKTCGHTVDKFGFYTKRIGEFRTCVCNNNQRVMSDFSGILGFCVKSSPEDLHRLAARSKRSACFAICILTVRVAKDRFALHLMFNNWFSCKCICSNNEDIYTVYNRVAKQTATPYIYIFIFKMIYFDCCLFVSLFVCMSGWIELISRTWWTQKLKLCTHM